MKGASPDNADAITREKWGGECISRGKRSRTGWMEIILQLYRTHQDLPSQSFFIVPSSVENFAMPAGRRVIPSGAAMFAKSYILNEAPGNLPRIRHCHCLFTHVRGSAGFSRANESQVRVVRCNLADRSWRCRVTLVIRID